MNTEELTIEGRTAKGIALLDERDPSWRSRVHPDSLNMADFYCCVLGQLFGTYSQGKYKLGLVYEGSWIYGFDCNFDERYIDLTIAWKEALSAL